MTGGMLLDIRLSERTSKITLVVQGTDGKHYGSIRTSRDVYPYLLEFLEKNQGRRLEDFYESFCRTFRQKKDARARTNYSPPMLSDIPQSGPIRVCPL